jgi:ribose/xylose/arabinose/galactoside ABC-type transport system permease subunit
VSSLYELLTGHPGRGPSPPLLDDATTDDGAAAAVGRHLHWDLGLQGLAVLAAISLGFGVIAGLIVGKGVAYRLVATAITTVACFGLGLVTSEVLFGWATQEELQPNIDGLSRDEVLLSSVLTTAVVVLVMRYLAPRTEGHMPHRGWHEIGRRHERHHHV